jgi:DNA-binding SARP family transcriptional activator/tetratricopeptide (TPR) repeat protein
MRFGILGPLHVSDAAGETAITAGRDRVVLAMLLLHAGRIVGVEELIDAVWDDAPPATARGQLQTCVSRLRRTLPHATILTNPAGYGIEIGDDGLDAAAFARLTARGRAVLHAAPDDARTMLRHALDLWRGPALAGIDSRAVRQAAAVLDEQHAVTIEDWVDLELDGGRDRDLVAELTGLVERFPLRERLRAQLMLTLYRVGRQADALAEYRRVRRVLHHELGVEPGAGLQALHRQILTGDVVGVAGAARTPGPARSVPPPAPIRALPRAVGDFTGRAGLLDALRAEIEAAPAGPLVRVIDGMPGIGKTTLAVHLAGLVGGRYPDAHLFIDLHGHSDRAAVEPAAALLTLLRQLGLAADRIPSGTDERVALWRSELAGRRVLVLLDNAASSAQVTPLLPGNGDSLVLVTGRRRLTGLDGVRPESVQVLDEAEAAALFARIVGERADAEPDAVREVVRRCGRLPLAIRLAGARLAHRPRWRVADLLRRLGEAALPELVAEDRTVLSAFALSYNHLSAEPQRLFRLLGLNPGERFAATAVAALADLELDAAEDLLDALVDVHLVEEPEPGLFRLHDLMREYAASLVAVEGPEYGRAAIVRLLDFHLQTIAVTGFQSQRQSLINDLKLGRPLRPDLADAVADHAAHMERERSNLLPFMAAGVAAGRPEYAWLLPRAAWRYLFTHGYMADIADSHARAMQVAREQGDDAAAAMTANSLAAAYSRMGRNDDARRMLELCVRLRRELGDEAGANKAMGNLAVVYESMGRLADSIDIAKQSLQICRRQGDYTSIGRRHSVLGHTYAQLGRPAEGLYHLRLELQVMIDEGDAERLSLAQTLLHIATLKRRYGLASAAVIRRMLRVCMWAYDANDYPIGTAEAYSELGLLCRAEGRYAEAIDLHGRAVAIAEGSGDRRFEAIFLNDYGATALAAGDPSAAAKLHARALEIAEDRHPYEQARALDGLGSSLVDTDAEGARRHWRRALVIFNRMGVPERYDVEKRLAGR